MSTTADPQPSSVPLDAGRMQALLDGEHAEIRNRVREMMSRPEFVPAESSLPRAEYRERVMSWAKAVAASGETLLGVPEEYGGQDNVGGTVAAFETLAHGDLSLLVKFGVQFGLFGGAVLHLGTKKHHDRYLRDIFSLELPGCFAMTETGHGSDVQSVETTATYDPSTREFVIRTPSESARKDYIGNAAVHGRMAATFAQLIVGGESHGVHCLLVPIRDAGGEPAPGVRIEDCGEKLGLNGVDNGRIWFDEVRVPREALLNRYADVSPEGEYSSAIENVNARFFTMLGTLVQGRVSVGGAGVSAAKSALTIAVRYASRRRQFGPPGSDDEALLLDYRMHQRRLMPLLARTYALHFAQEQLVADFHRAFTEPDFPERDRRQLESVAAGLKSMATWHATETIQTCREACGGAGYLYVNRLASLKADTDVFTTFEGDNTVLLQLVAKSLLTDYRDQFGELDPLGMVGFVAGQVIETLVERSAARELIGRLIDDWVPGRDEEADLLDREYHLKAYEWREAHVLAAVARRLKRGVDSGMDAFDVFNECQDHVYTLARVHVERLMLERFAAAIDRCEDDEVRPVLDRLCSAFVMEEMQRDRGWFQEHGRFSSTRAKAVTRTLNALCADLRADACALVDAFGIPDAVLAAPIGLREDQASGYD